MQKLLIAILLLLATDTLAQTVRDIATLTNTARNIISLDADYCTLHAEQGEQEAFDKTFRKRTPADIMATQKEKLKERNKIMVLQCEPCVLPYTQLDTQANISYKRNLIGYWRAVAIRTVQFTDSTDNKAEQFIRTSRILDEDTSGDMFISITEDDFRLYYKEAGKEKFRVITDNKYELQGKRYLLLYKNMKSAGDVSVVGIDSTGRLILNTYTAAQRRVPNNYTVHETTASQIVLEKLKVAQLHYKEEKKDKPIPSRKVSPN